MRHEIIKLENYLLVVDDSEIKEGDYFYVTTKNIVGGNVVSQSIGNGEFAWTEHILSTETDERGYHPSNCKKIIAHLPMNNSPILEGVDLLPPSISQPKQPIAFECAYQSPEDRYYEDGVGYTHNVKRIDNSQGQSVWVGKYIYA